MRLMLPLAFAATLLAVLPAAAQTLTVVGQSGQSKTLTAKDLEGLPRAEATLTQGTKKEVYEGVTLTSVLREAGAPAGARMHGAPLKLYLVVTGQDGYQVVLSLAETDAWFKTGPVILADRKKEGALAANEALRLIIDGELVPYRDVRQVVKIEIKSLP